MTLVQEHPEIKDRITTLLPPQNISVPELQDFAEDYIEARFERVPGVSNSEVHGGREEEMQVIVDPQKLAARRLTIYDIRNALRDENRDISAGDLWEGKRRYVVRTLGRFRSPEQVGRSDCRPGPARFPNLPARCRANQTGIQEADRFIAQFRRALPVGQLRAGNRRQRAGRHGGPSTGAGGTESRPAQ